MIQSTLGRIIDAKVTHSLSGYTFCELSFPMDEYSGSNTFILTTGDISQEYTTVASEVYTQAGEETRIKLSGILSEHIPWMGLKPLSLDNANISEILTGLGLSDGPDITVSLININLSLGQFVITLSNMSPKIAMVDFENNKVLYYPDIYKSTAIQVPSAFRRVYGRTPLAGYVGWDSINLGDFPDGLQTVLPFGQFTNIGEQTMKNLINNLNNLSALFSDMQVFTTDLEIPLGNTVLSPLTFDKKVAVAVEEIWTHNACLRTYYCV